MCAKFRFSISSRCDELYAPPPPSAAAGGWREGPAADGLKDIAIRMVKNNLSKDAWISCLQKHKIGEELSTMRHHRLCCAIIVQQRELFTNFGKHTPAKTYTHKNIHPQVSEDKCLM